MNKRRKRREKDKKPRKRNVLLDFGCPVPIDEFRVGRDGSIQAFHKGVVQIPASATTSIQYDRAKGPKVLSQVVQTFSPTAQSYTENALAGYDRIMVVDTNSRTIRGEKVHATVVILCELRPEQDRILIAYALHFAFEFTGEIDKPERFAWRELLGRLTLDPARGLRIALAVDSDLGAHRVINARTEAIYGDFFLPEGIDIVYASADAGKEVFLNVMIAECDAVATHILETIEEKAPANYAERSVFGSVPFHSWVFQP